MFESRDEQLVIQIPALEIFVPGRGLLHEQYSAFAETPISLSARRAFFFSLVANTASLLQLGEIGLTNRICTGSNAFTKRDAAITP